MPGVYTGFNVVVSLNVPSPSPFKISQVIPEVGTKTFGGESESVMKSPVRKIVPSVSHISKSEPRFTVLFLFTVNSID